MLSSHKSFQPWKKVANRQGGGVGGGCRGAARRRNEGGYLSSLWSNPIEKKYKKSLCTAARAQWFHNGHVMNLWMQSTTLERFSYKLLPLQVPPRFLIKEAVVFLLAGDTEGCVFVLLMVLHGDLIQVALSTLWTLIDYVHFYLRASGEISVMNSTNSAKCLFLGSSVQPEAWSECDHFLQSNLRDSCYE